MSKNITIECIIKKIRDILRKEGITGMDSINHCILFIVARWLSIDKCKKLDIPEQYSFEKILERTEDDDKDDDDKLILYPRFYKKGQQDCLVSYIINKLGFGNIKFRMTNMDHLEIIFKKLGKIDLDKLHTVYDIIGIVYELHLKTGSSNARDLGQYFTDRRVIEYMVELCDPKLYEDGTIDKIIDPTMGTAGFLTMAIKYLNKNYEIDWKKNINNIYGIDIDLMVKNMGSLNVWLETGENPTHLNRCDTLRSDLSWSFGKVLDKANVILANMPYGIKNIVYKECCKRIRNLKIKGSHAEPLFLQLFMEALDDGGRCAVVVPDGMLFNNSKLHVETRKYLMEHFSLKKVISMDKGFFLNTNVQTSILFFENTGYQTSKVEFCEIKIKDGKIEEKIMLKVKIKEIEKNNYSLFINRYNVEKKEKIEGIEYKKLGEICECISSKYNSGLMDNNGIYEFYNGCAKNPAGKHSTYNFNYNEYIALIKGGGAGHGKYGDQIGLGKVFYLTGKNAISNGLYILKVTYEKILTKYVYYILKTIKNDIMDLATYTTGLGNIKQENLKNIEIPVPSLKMQNEIVRQMDFMNDCNKTCEQRIKQLGIAAQNFVNIQQNEQALIEKMESLCDFTCVKHDTSFGQEIGKYKFYTGGVRTELYTDICDVKQISIIINRTNGSGKCNIFLDKNFSCATQTLVFTTKNEVTTKYIYYYFKNNINLLEEGYQGTKHKNITLEYVMNIEIPVPSLDIQNKIVEYCDKNVQRIELLKQEIEENNKMEKQIMISYTKGK